MRKYWFDCEMIPIYYSFLPQSLRKNAQNDFPTAQ